MDMDDAWPSQDLGSANSGGGISIPTQDALANGPGAGPVVDDSGWPPAGGRSPRHGGSVPPRRSSRSRSPSTRDRRDDRDRDREDRRENLNPGNNLHVSGLPSDVTNEALEAVFVKVGRVQKASIMLDPHTKESRGFAFVTMETPEEADAAINALNATKQFDKVISVGKARRARARTPTPGRYYGPPKRRDYERPYDPRPYDSRYSRDYRDDRRSGRYDDSRGGGRYDDRDRRYGRGEGGRGEGGRGDRDRDRGYDRDRRY